MQKRVRICAVQYDQQPVSSFEQFADQINQYVAYAVDDKCDLIVFPEFVTMALFAVDPNPNRWTELYRSLGRDLARSSNMLILGGTHVTEREGTRYNTAHLFFPDGQMYTQEKLHLTPCEVEPWRFGRGDDIKVIDTPVGRIAILVCFDSEFPEAALAAAEAGADILLVPAATADRQGFWRVRHCCHARAVENQVYVVHSALVGRLPQVRYMEQYFGTSAIITPCDVPFPPRGVAAEGEWNQGLCVVGEVDLDLLQEVRESGSVLPRMQRRPEAYRVQRI
jgi:predicted amidohydrolase